MSRGQTARTVENFPRMKDRAGARRRRRAARDAEFIAWLDVLAESADKAAEAIRAMGRELMDGMRAIVHAFSAPREPERNAFAMVPGVINLGPLVTEGMPLAITARPSEDE